MSDQFYVGLDVTGFEDNGRRPAVASVTLQVDGQRVVTAGNYDSGGMDLYALCPYGTQEMANAILARAYGYQFQSFQADAANLDPAAELGDGVTVGGIYGVISAIQDSGDGYPSLSAPGQDELEDEYPYRNTTERFLTGDMDSLRAFIQQYLGAMNTELNTMKTELQIMTQTLETISNKVTQLDSRVSALEGGS